MRVTEIEGWLLRMGWQPDPLKGGSTRAWRHERYPGQRLTYHAPHKADGADLRPDVVKEIYRDLAAMRPVEDDGADDAQASA